MATVVTKACKLSHKAFRVLLKKFRRKKKRQQLAKARDQQDSLAQKVREAHPNFKELVEEQRRNEELWEQFQEKEKRRKHREWLLRENEAQAEFRKKKFHEEQEALRKEEERKRMLEELEHKNLLESFTAELNRQTKEKKEETLQEALSGLPEAEEPWHNPIAPVSYSVSTDQEQCSFFAKTGCCRFGERCSRGHIYPEVSVTLLIRGMFSHFSIEQGNCDDYDTDMALEFEDRDMYQDFKSFYEDVLPEFQKCGRVVQFKVCCNHEPHLRGNVYVQYSREEYAVEAFKKFNGRFYGGKQLSCEFTSIPNWKAAICGLFVSKRCPKGNNCNFLHVFRNPTNQFWAADRNLPDHPRLRHKKHSSSHRSNRSKHGSSVYHNSDSYFKSSSRFPSHHSSLSSRSKHHDSDPHSSEGEHYSEKQDSRSNSNRNNSSHRRRKKRRRSSSSSFSSSSLPEKESGHRKKHKKSKKRKKTKRSSSP